MRETVRNERRRPAGRPRLTTRQRLVLMVGGPALLVLLLHHWLTPLFWPAPGVMCDRVEGFCGDAWGRSESLTAAYLGARKAGAVREARDRGEDMTVMKTSAGVTCDASLRQCWQDTGHVHPDPVATERLFHAGLADR